MMGQRQADSGRGRGEGVLGRWKREAAPRDGGGGGGEEGGASRWTTGSGRRWRRGGRWATA